MATDNKQLEPAKGQNVVKNALPLRNHLLAYSPAPIFERQMHNAKPIGKPARHGATYEGRDE